MSVLEVKELGLSVAAPGGAKHILRSVSFSIAAGEILGLVGESGSGKTTIARCIAGLLRPEHGTIRCDNGDHAVQMLFQNHRASLDPRLTVRDSLAEAIRNRDVVPERILMEAMSNVELGADLLDRFPHQLSGGQCQRVALARAILAEPALVILDEPTSALDTVTGIQMLRVLRRVCAVAKMGMLIISHDLLSTLLVCDRIAVLHDGEIVDILNARNPDLNSCHPYTRRIFELSASVSRG